MIVAGFGFRAGASLSSLRDALARACADGAEPDVLAAPADKIALLRLLAQERQVPAVPVAGEALEAAATVTLSTASLAARRTGSVAEASALAAAGPGARLLTARHISSDRMATCAMAQGANS